MSKIAIITFILILLGSAVRIASADEGYYQVSEKLDSPQLAAATLVPTVSPSQADSDPTPEPRVLPEVGSNAGLVIGASVLVLIIIGGVLGARQRTKH